MTNDENPPVTCCLSGEHGLGKKRLIQIAMDHRSGRLEFSPILAKIIGERIQIGRPPPLRLFCNLSLDEAKKLAAELAEAIGTVERAD